MLLYIPNDLIQGEGTGYEFETNSLLHTLDGDVFNNGKFLLQGEIMTSVEEFETDNDVMVAEDYTKLTSFKLSIQYLEDPNANYDYCRIEYNRSVSEKESMSNDIILEKYSEQESVIYRTNNDNYSSEEYLLTASSSDEVAEKFVDFSSDSYDVKSCSVESFIKGLEDEGVIIKEEYLDGVYFLRLEIDPKRFDVENLKGEKNGK